MHFSVDDEVNLNCLPEILRPEASSRSSTAAIPAAVRSPSEKRSFFVREIS